MSGHNKLYETAFARVDFLLHCKPKFNILAMEDYVMISFIKKFRVA